VFDLHDRSAFGATPAARLVAAADSGIRTLRAGIDSVQAPPAVIAARASQAWRHRRPAPPGRP
jgi:hypothetical protein